MATSRPTESERVEASGPLSRSDSDAKLNGYTAGFEQHGYSRWLIETAPDDECTGVFVGYAGVDPSRDFVVHDPGLGNWTGLVWTTTTPKGSFRVRGHRASITSD